MIVLKQTLRSTSLWESKKTDLRCFVQNSLETSPNCMLGRVCQIRAFKVLNALLDIGFKNGDMGQCMQHGAVLGTERDHRREFLILP